MINAQTVLLPTFNSSIQLNYTVDGPNGHLRRNLRGALVGDDSTAVRLGGGLNVRSLTLVRDDGTTVRFGGSLDVGGLAFVGDYDATVRFGGGLNVGSLTLKGPLNSSLEEW